jgi:hypothetical protein
MFALQRTIDYTVKRLLDLREVDNATLNKCKTIQ